MLFDPRLSAAALERLVDRCVSPVATERFGAYLFFSDEPTAELARHVEQTVFLDSFGNTPELLAAEYSPYERNSVYLCVIDHEFRRPAGVIRLLLPVPAGLKSLNDMEAVWGESAEQLFLRAGTPFIREKTWDIATLAVDLDYRGAKTKGAVAAGLYQTLTLAALACGVNWFIAILDAPVFRSLRWQLCSIFQEFEGVEPREYLGSVASIPAWCDVAAAERRLAEVNPRLHTVLVRGIGLEESVRRVDFARIERLQSWWRSLSLETMSIAERADLSRS